MKSSSRRRFLKSSAIAGGAAFAGALGLDRLSPWIFQGRLLLEPNQSFWALSQPPPNPPLSADLDVDVAVLGGGLTGLSAAYFLRTTSPHKSVAVLEARGCGNGASGRNGAMVLTMTADRYMNFSADPSVDARIYELTAGNVGFLAKLSAATGIDCDLDTQGALQVCDTSEELDAARDYVSKARSLGMPVELWDARRVAGAVGTEAYRGGFFDPGGGHVHPMKLVQVFKTAAQAAGAKIFENTRVEGIEEGRGHVLHTGDGRAVRARSLVLAANAFTPGLGFLRNSVLPLREYVAVTRILSEPELSEIGWRERIPFNDSRTEVYYLGLTRDRRIHIGGGTPGYSFNDRPGGSGESDSHLRQLKQELVRIYPKLSGIDFAMAWDGVIDWSLDSAPSVGSTGRHGNVFYAIGYSGHGVNLTSVFGRIIADLEAGRAERWSGYPFLNNRLYYVPNEPFRWLAAEAGISLYALGDSSARR